MAQLVARLVRNEKVGGSNPPSSTTGRHPIRMSVFCMPGVVLRCLVLCCLASLVFWTPHVLSCGPGCSVCPWAAARPIDRAACGATGVPGAGGPGRCVCRWAAARPRDRHTRACGSEWSISRPALALPPPTGTAARPRYRPRALQPDPATAHGHRSQAVLCLSALHIDESGCVRG